MRLKGAKVEKLEQRHYISEVLTTGLFPSAKVLDVFFLKSLLF